MKSRLSVAIAVAFDDGQWVDEQVEVEVDLDNDSLVTLIQDEAETEFLKRTKSRGIAFVHLIYWKKRLKH